MSKRLEFLYDIYLQFECPVQGHSFCLRCMPQDFPGQKITDVSFAVSPDARCCFQHDSFGNLLQHGRVDAPHTFFHYSVMGTAVTDSSAAGAGGTMDCFRFESPLTHMSPEMKVFADSLILPHDETGRALYIMHSLRERLEYVPGTTGIQTTAGDAFAAGRGVCQDYAHIYIALSRYLGIPARYINGLTEGDCVSHAWTELLLNGRWTGVDPTRGRLTDESYIVFNRGRDFCDCPIERGVFTGITAQTQQIMVQVSQ